MNMQIIANTTIYSTRSLNWGSKILNLVSFEKWDTSHFPT